MLTTLSKELGTSGGRSKIKNFESEKILCSSLAQNVSTNSLINTLKAQIQQGGNNKEENTNP